MDLLFTGALKCNASQLDGKKSLGGYPSSTSIPNGEINAIFDMVSLLSKERLSRDTICLALYNDESNDVVISDIVLEYNRIQAQADYRIGIESPSDDGEGNPYFTLIGNSLQLPLGIQIVDMISGDPMQLNHTLESGKYLGIWIQRQLIPDIDTSIKKSGLMMRINY